MVISNHINWFDTWYHGFTFMPLSFVGKAAAKNFPIVGSVADFFHTIWVDRQNEHQRDSVIEKISERVRKFN